MALNLANEDDGGSDISQKDNAGSNVGEIITKVFCSHAPQKALWLLSYKFKLSMFRNQWSFIPEMAYHF